MSGLGCTVDIENALLANSLSNVRSRRPPLVLRRITIEPFHQKQALGKGDCAAHVCLVWRVPTAFSSADLKWALHWGRYFSSL